MTETRFTAVPTTRYQRPNLAGTVIGAYRVIGEISSGGMGTVYRARHELLDRFAAIKLLRPDLDVSDELIDRFLIEAKSAAAIKHPGIVDIYDYGITEDGSAFLAMELLEGKPLARALSDVERFSEYEAANIARGIASALKAAHARGIIHRDLKPDNVFLVPDLEGPTGAVRPKVLDFGIAKLSERAPDAPKHTQIGALMGTPLYMAPEQAREASAIDHRADLYSLGCILYELLTGKPPFVAEGAGEIVAMHLFSSPDSPRTKIPDLSPEMDVLVMRLLEKEPAQRFQSAGEVVNALQPFVGGRVSAEHSAQLSGPRPVQQHVPTLREAPTYREAPPQAPKRSLPLIAGAMTATIAIAVIVFLLLRGSTTESGAQPPEPSREPTKPPPTQVTTPAPAPSPAPAPTATTTTTTTEAKPQVAPVRPVSKPQGTRQLAPVVTDTKPPPGPADARPITAPTPKPRGPTTENGSPIENELEDVKKPKDPS